MILGSLTESPKANADPTTTNRTSTQIREIFIEFSCSPRSFAGQCSPSFQGSWQSLPRLLVRVKRKRVLFQKIAPTNHRLSAAMGNWHLPAMAAVAVAKKAGARKLRLSSQLVARIKLEALTPRERSESRVPKS